MKIFLTIYIIIIALTTSTVIMQIKTMKIYDQIEIIYECKEMGYDTGFYLEEGNKDSGVCGNI